MAAAAAVMGHPHLQGSGRRQLPCPIVCPQPWELSSGPEAGSTRAPELRRRVTAPSPLPVLRLTSVPAILPGLLLDGASSPLRRRAESRGGG